MSREYADTKRARPSSASRPDPTTGPAASIVRMLRAHGHDGLADQIVDNPELARGYSANEIARLKLELAERAAR